MVKRYFDNATDVGEQTNIISHSAPHSIASTSIYSSSTNYNQKDFMYPSEGQGCIYPILSYGERIAVSSITLETPINTMTTLQRLTRSAD